MTTKPLLRPATPIDTELAESEEEPTEIEKKKREAKDEKENARRDRP